MLATSPLFPCLLNKPPSLADATALRMSLPPAFLDLVARHAAAGRDARALQLVVLLLGSDAPGDIDYAAPVAAGQGSYKFVQHAPSSSDIDAVVVSCSYPHLHLLPLWVRAQLHVTFATIGACTPPLASIVHIPHSASSSSHIQSVVSAFLSPFIPSSFSPLSPTSRTRIAARAYATCNVSGAAAAARDGGGAAAALARTIACLEEELTAATMGLQLQYLNPPLRPRKL